MEFADLRSGFGSVCMRQNSICSRFALLRIRHDPSASSGPQGRFLSAITQEMIYHFIASSQ